MFWLILSIGLFVLSISLMEKNSTGGSLCLFSIAILIATIFGLGFSMGVSTYPRLSAQREGVLSLQSEVETIRSAYYPNKGQGSLIGGSLENLEQSKALSAYISTYAQKKAEYNQSLKEAQIYKQSPIFFWFSNSVMISDKILDLQRIN